MRRRAYGRTAPRSEPGRAVSPAAPGWGPLSPGVPAEQSPNSPGRANGTPNHPRRRLRRARHRSGRDVEAAVCTRGRQRDPSRPCRRAPESELRPPAGPHGVHAAARVFAARGRETDPRTRTDAPAPPLPQRRVATGTISEGREDGGCPGCRRGRCGPGCGAGHRLRGGGPSRRRPRSRSPGRATTSRGPWSSSPTAASRRSPRRRTTCGAGPSPTATRRRRPRYGWHRRGCRCSCRRRGGSSPDRHRDRHGLTTGFAGAEATGMRRWPGLCVCRRR